MNAIDPAKIVSLLQILLCQLESALNQAPQALKEDERADNLKNQLQGYREKVSRVNAVLSKHRDAEKHRRELERYNKAAAQT